MPNIRVNQHFSVKNAYFCRKLNILFSALFGCFGSAEYSAKIRAEYSVEKTFGRTLRLCNLGRSLFDDVVERAHVDLAHVGHHLGGDVRVVEDEEHHHQDRRRRRQQPDRHAPNVGQVAHLEGCSSVSGDFN